MAFERSTCMLLICFFLNAFDQTEACMPATQSGSLTMIFDVEPSVNVTIGDKVVLNCSVHSSGDLEDLQIHSRSVVSKFNTTCTQPHGQKRQCLVEINDAGLQHQGEYDCIATHKGPSFECYQSSLRLTVVDKPITQSTTELTTDTPLITSEILKSTDSVENTKARTTTCGTCQVVSHTRYIAVLVNILTFLQIT